MKPQQALDPIQDLVSRLVRIEVAIQQLVEQRLSRDWYTTAEAAQVLGRRPFTVREWCRLGRVHGEKTICGRGLDAEWRISREELIRIQNHGLLPLPKYRFDG